MDGWTAEWYNGPPDHETIQGKDCMPINDALLPEFDQEMARTRRLLERVPDEKAAWTPQEKSRSLGALASHLADIPGRMGRSAAGREAPPHGRRVQMR